MAGRAKIKAHRIAQEVKLKEGSPFWDVLFLAIGVQGMSLAEFCKLEDVSYNVVSKLLKTDVNLRTEYADARTERANQNLERISDLSEQVLTDPKNSNAYKISYEMKKWQAQVLDRATFGEKVEQTVNMNIDLNTTYLDQLKNLMTNKPKIIDQSKKDSESIEHKV